MTVEDDLREALDRARDLAVRLEAELDAALAELDDVRAERDEARSLLDVYRRRATFRRVQ